MVVVSRVIQTLGFSLGLGGLSLSLIGAGQKSKKPTPVPKPTIVFSRDILPILSDKCFKCHGPDAGTRMGNMRLDTKEGAFANRSGKFPIVPGNTAHSMVVERINDKDAPMPPEDSGKKLTPQEKKLVTQWIAEGAKYSKLWSFEPIPDSVPIPSVEGTWPKGNIDRFILARLKTEGLTPSPAADRFRWLRRVTLDLTGLPPTEAEIDAFASDTKADAYDRVVDRLLSSPRFGERMAVDWLDAARYSDSYGYQSDLIMPSWPYRDWVVRAFNQGMPYNEFLTEQLAGDEMPNATRETRLATAFNRLHRQSNEGGSIALEYKTEYASDRVSTFGTSILGLTLGCAKCHDHKFDPITQKEYYQMFAYFNSIDEYGLLLSSEIVPTPSLLLPSKEQETRLTLLKDAAGAARAVGYWGVASSTSRYDQWLANKPTKLQFPELVAHFSLDDDKLANSVSDPAKIDRIGSPAVVDGHSGKALQLDGENGIIVRGLKAVERWDPFTWSFWMEDPRTNKGPTVLLHRTGGTDVGFCGFDLILEDGYLTARVMRHWPGNGVGIRTKNPIPASKWTHVAWSWDGTGAANGMALYVNGEAVETTILQDKLWKTIHAYGDLGPSGGDWSFGQRFREAGFKGGKLDDIAYAERSLSPLEVHQLFDPTSFDRALAKPDRSLGDYYQSAIDPEYRASMAAMQKSERDVAEFENQIPEISVMEDSRQEIPAYLLFRGNYNAPRTPETMVHRNVPASLPVLKAASTNNRLALAQWVTRSDNPLTARVAVNRMWQIMFGTGLVETSENFGVQGSQPTHPELLDYLARHFIQSGWNVKGLMREMALSATYRQDSARTAKLNKVDPLNKLLARGPSQRLSAEMVRDTVLAASGLLNEKIGGAPVNPYQPAGIWTENNTMTPSFVQSKGADLYRRSLYTTWKRTTPVPSMLVFDATSREACIVRRPSTNTPLQALVLLNDVQYVEAARALAERVMKAKPGLEDRIGLAFELLSGRHPTRPEVQILSSAFAEQKAQFQKTPDDAKKLIHVGDSKPDEKLDAVDLAAMTVTVQATMNSDAVVWKR